MDPTSPRLIDERLLRAQSDPIRAHILNILSEGPSSPSRMKKRMKNVSLERVSYHVRVLRSMDLIELVEVRQRGGRKEHIYRATRRQYFDLAEWKAIDPKFRDPITTTILQQISEDTGQAVAEGRVNERLDRHLSRAPVDLDEEGWQEVVETLKQALWFVLEAHARSRERVAANGGDLFPARVMMMQFPLGRSEAR